MKANRIVFIILPVAMMTATAFAITGIETWLVGFGKTEAAKLALGRAGVAAPYVAAAALGLIFLFATAGSASIRAGGAGATIGNAVIILTACLREVMRLAELSSQVPAGKSALFYLDPSTMIGAAAALMSGCFALRVAMFGNAAFARPTPKRIIGKRALHGEADWMKPADASRLFPATGGIVVGERYRVDRDSVAGVSFRADDTDTWGHGGKSPLLCFDGSFGSSHGIVFAGSGGFKTTSVTIPTALKWAGSLVVLDPSNEVAPMVSKHREEAGRRVRILDPRRPATGFNALDWVGGALPSCFSLSFPISMWHAITEFISPAEGVSISA